MFIDQLRALREAKPFASFVITMSEGSQYLVADRGDMILTEDGIIALRDQTGTLRILNHIQISEVAIVRQASARVAPAAA